MEKTINIYLDDERQTPFLFNIRTYKFEDTVAALYKYTGYVNILSLDHDLGNDKLYGTGYDVMLFLEEQASKGNFKILPQSIVFHTANPVGRKRMEKCLEKILEIKYKHLL